jgi:ubiquinone biosynthesis accessory factor UbiJ
MSNQSPISLLKASFQTFADALKPPAWASEELQRRIVLLLNHVLQQEKEAMTRLARQKGRVVHFQWRHFSLKWVATAAGLLDQADPEAQVDLTLVVTEGSPFALMQGLLQGQKPAVRIEGDVQLAAEVNWLFDHVRWDLEEDLARLVGDVPAHALGGAVRRTAEVLRQFSSRAPEKSQSKAGA